MEMFGFDNEKKMNKTNSLFQNKINQKNEFTLNKIKNLGFENVNQTQQQQIQQQPQKNNQTNFLTGILGITENQKQNKKQNNQNKNKQNGKEEEKGILNTITNVVGITTNTSIPVNMDESKRHYFIGYMITEQNMINELNRLQKELIQKYNLKNYYLNFNNKFMSRYVYMGYLTPQVATKYMDYMMGPLCVEVTKKFPPLECNFTKVRPKFDQSINWLSLFYDDENDYLKKVIIPFLDKKGIKPIFPKRFTNYQPMIDLINFKSHTIPKRVQHLDVTIPNMPLQISHLSLISGKPTQSKLGYQSVHDNLIYEEEAKFQYPFSG